MSVFTRKRKNIKFLRMMAERKAMNRVPLEPLYIYNTQLFKAF